MKKLLMAFFTVMSVVSVYAYNIDVNNESDRKIIASIDIPYRWKGPLTLERGESKQFSDLSEKNVREISISVIREGSRKRWKRAIVIPIKKRGKDITVDVDINESVRADPAAISIEISKTQSRPVQEAG